MTQQEIVALGDEELLYHFLQLSLHPSEIDTVLLLKEEILLRMSFYPWKEP
jgi:hypothetical protein